MPGQDTPPNGATPNPKGNDGGSSPPAQPGGGGAPAAATRPESLPERFWDAKAGAPKLDDLIKSHSDLEGYKAAIESYAAQVPGKADGYAIALPKDVDLGKGPDGKPIQWQPNPDDPMLAPFREWAHKHGLSQASFTEALSIYAKGQAAGLAQQTEFLAAEKAKMGEKADARIDAAGKFLDAKLGGAHAAALKELMQFADGLEAVEAVMALVMGPRAGRSGGEGGASKPDLSKMTLAEKEALSEREMGGLVKQMYG